MSRNKQKPGMPRRDFIPSVQQIAGSPGPTVDALGKTWRLGFNDQNAKGALEELIRAYVIRRELPTKRALGGEEGERYWQEEVKPLLDRGYYDTFGRGWLEVLRSTDGTILFFQSLLLKNHPGTTQEQAREIFAVEPEQVIEAVGVVSPDFFAAVAIQVGHSTDQAKEAAPKIAAAVRERFAETVKEFKATMRTPAPTTPEPATDSITVAT